MATFESEDFLFNPTFINFVIDNLGFSDISANRSVCYEAVENAIRAGHDLPEMVAAYDVYNAELEEENKWFYEYSEWVERNPGVM
jgi:hypothetical protein